MYITQVYDLHQIGIFQLIILSKCLFSSAWNLNFFIFVLVKHVFFLMNFTFVKY